MKTHFFLVMAICTLSLVGCLDLAIIDFLEKPTLTRRGYPTNFLGISLNYKETESLLSENFFKNLQLNTNLKSNWQNNFFSNIRLPAQWGYMCNLMDRPFDLPNSSRRGNPFASTTTTNSSVNLFCERDISPPDIFLNITSDYLSSTQAPQTWIMGIERLPLLSSSLVQLSYNQFFNQLFFMTGNKTYQVELGFEVDRYVSKGYKNLTYSSAEFLQELKILQNIAGGLVHRAPGVSENATEEWVNIIDEYFRITRTGIFTFSSTIFSETPSISSLLNSNYTKGYFQRKAKVNETFSYEDFNDINVALANVRLVEGNGINGITNSFAAGLWFIEFLIEGAIFSLIDVSFDGTFRDGYHQSMWIKTQSGYKPSIFYYAGMLANLAGEGSAQIVLPDVKSLIQNKIKAYGFLTPLTHRFLVLNKDENPSNEGTFILMAKSFPNEVMKCIALKGQSLNSTSNFTIAGHFYTEETPEPQGPYKFSTYEYDASIQGFKIRIQYAEVLLCEVGNPNLLLQTDTCWEMLGRFVMCLLLILISL